MIANANSLMQHVIQIKNIIIKHVNVSVKIIVHANKIIIGIFNTSAITCDQIISLTKKMINIMVTNVTSTSSINWVSR